MRSGPGYGRSKWASFFLLLSASLTLGYARLDPENISMTIDRGSDFPQAIQDKLNTFSKGSNGLWRWRERKQGGTTRAVNIYRGEQRGFEYLSEKIRLDPIHLLEEAAPSGNVSGNLPRFIHFICSPQRALQIVDQVDELQDHWNDRKRPKLVWEPIPDSAKAENLDDCIRVMQRIDVISPNHEEAASFLSVSLQDILSPASVLSTAHICATLARRLAVGLAERCPPSLRPLVCIRAGKYGSAVLVPSSAAVEGSKDQMGWAEAYHTESDSHRVLDVTGAGNAWLGGFVASLVLHDREKRQRGSSESWSLGVALKAAMMGSVSACESAILVASIAS